MMCVVVDAGGKKLGSKRLRLAQLAAELEYERCASEAKTQKIIKLECEIAWLKQEVKKLRESSAKWLVLKELFD